MMKWHWCYVYLCTHTYARTRTRTRTRTHTRPYTHAYIYTYTQIHHNINVVDLNKVTIQMVRYQAYNTGRKRRRLCLVLTPTPRCLDGHSTYIKHKYSLLITLKTIQPRVRARTCAYRHNIPPYKEKCR